MKTKRFTVHRTASGTYNRKPFTHKQEIELNAVDASAAQQQAADLFLPEKEGTVVEYRVEVKKADSAVTSVTSGRLSSRKGLESMARRTAASNRPSDSSDASTGSETKESVAIVGELGSESNEEAVAVGEAPQQNIQWEYDDRIGQWIDPKTGKVRPEDYGQEDIPDDSEEYTESGSASEPQNDEAEDGSSSLEDGSSSLDDDLDDDLDDKKPAFTLSREQIGQGMRWTKDEERGEPLPCPSCGRGLVEVPKERQLFHVCCSLLESEYPACDYFVKVVKESTKPDYGKESKSDTSKKAKRR